MATNQASQMVEPTKTTNQALQAAEPTRSRARPTIPPAATTYRMVSRMHHLRSHAARLAGAFDPSLGDVADADDFDDDDSDMDPNSDEDEASDGHHDHGSVYSMQDDDQSIHSDDDPNSDDHDHHVRGSQGGDSQHERGLGAAHRGLPGSAAKLPTTRSSKPSELITARDVVAAASAPKPPQSNNGAPARAEPAQPAKPKTTTNKSTSIGRELPAADKPAQAAPVTAPVVATQIVKVRKPDGTIVKVRRPIKPGSTATTAATNTATEPAAMSTTGQDKFEARKSVSEVPKPEIDAVPEHVAQPKKPEPPSNSSKALKSGLVISESEKVDDGSDEGSNPKRAAEGRLGRRTTKATQIIVWTIMVAAPLLFMILGVLTAATHGRPADSSFGARVKQANSIAVSLWPIVYAAIAAQALRMYACYKVESGLRLMTLEQLMSSHSVASAIKQPCLLQRVNWISVALLCLWSLSPLAGQALLHMSYIGNDGSTGNFTLQYVNTTSIPPAFDTSLYNGFAQPMVDAVFGSSILAPLTSQNAPMDTWGNTKIPLFEDLRNLDQTGWYTVDASPSYSSLVGIPVANLTDAGQNSSFTIPSGYFSFDCPPVTQATMEYINSTFNATGFVMEPYSSASGTIQLGARIMIGGQQGRGNLMFASQSPSQGNTYSYTNCTFNQSFVESQVFCADSQCIVKKMRAIPNPNSVSPLDGYDYHYWLMGFVQWGSSIRPGIHTPIENFLRDPTSAGANNENNPPDLSTVPSAALTARLSLLLNTYFQAGISPNDLTGSFGTNLNPNNPPLNVTASYVNTNQIYRTSWGWLTLLLISSVILLVGGVAGAICDARTVGPDIFGFASSLARKNKYMKVPDGGSAMSGPQRARMLGDVKVMLQDVKGDAEVGRIALGTVDNGGHKLRHGRLYR